MNCEEIRDLMSAYALGTATDDEIAAVEDHLAGCGLHDEVAALKASTVLLASSAKGVEPPPALRDRVMAHAAAPVGGDARDSGPGQWWLRRFIAVNPIAAILVVALGLMVVWNITLQGANSPAEVSQPAEKFVHFYRGTDSGWLRIETVLGDPGAEVSLGGFARLDDSQMYNLWTLRGDEVLLIGAFNVNTDGKWAGEFNFVFEEGDRVWMTPEPASGTDVPTGEAILKTRF